MSRNKKRHTADREDSRPGHTGGTPPAIQAQAGASGSGAPREPLTAREHAPPGQPSAGGGEGASWQFKFLLGAIAVGLLGLLLKLLLGG